MAKSQTFTAGCSAVGSFGYAGNFTLYVVLTDRDGNTGTNISQVDYNVYCQSNGSGSINANHYLYFNINGGDKRNETIKVNVSSPYAYISIASGTISVEHNADGSKTIPFSAQIKASSYGVSSSVSGNFELEKIPRYFTSTPYISFASKTLRSITINWSTSEPCDRIDYKAGDLVVTSAWTGNATSGTITITGLGVNTNYSIYIWCRRKDSQLGSTSNTISATTYDYARITSAPNFNDENNPTITYTNPFGNNIQSLKACISWTGGADIAYRDISKTGTSYTFPLTEDERNKLRQAATSNTLAVKFYVTTYHDGETFYSTLQRTLTIVNANPTFVDFRFVDADDATYNLTGDYKAIIKGESNPYVYIPVANKAVANKYATMDKYRISIGSQTAEVPYSSTSEVGTTLYNVSSDSITVYAVDSRGNSTAKQLWASRFIDYFPPNITRVEAIRTDSVKPETTLYFSGTFWNGNFGVKNNAITGCHYKYRLVGTSQWKGQTELGNLNISGNTFSYSIKMNGDLGAEGFDINNSYEISVAITDYLNGREAPIFTLGPGLPGIAIYKNFVAIGQRYDTSIGGVLQVNGRIRSNANRFTLNSEGLQYDNVYYEFYKNGSRAAWLGFGTDGSNIFTIQNQTGGEVRCGTNFLWESPGFSNENYNDFRRSGTFYMSENNTNAPEGKSYCRMLTMGSSYSGDTAQLATYVSSGATWIRGSSNSQWHEWRRVTQFIPRSTSADFNSITEPGIHTSGSSPTGANVPITSTGTLEVITNYGVITQRYTPYRGDRIYQRGYYVEEGWQPWRVFRGESILYYNTSGTNGTVTLSESAANFAYIEIFFRSSYGHYSSVKVYAPGGKAVLLQAFHVFASSSGTVAAESKVVNVSGTSIYISGTEDQYGKWWSYNSNIEVVNNIYIYQVAGYR